MFAARTSLRAVRSARPQVQSRLASSTTESAKEAAVSAAAKAQAAAGPALERGAALWKTATDSAGSALGAYKEPILGNAAVAREVLKQVYVAEKLSPPSLAQVTHTYSSFFNSTKNPSFWKTLLESGEWKRYGIYAIEAYGVFKIGEMIGRRHMVGYKLDESKPAAVA